MREERAIEVCDAEVEEIMLLCLDLPSNIEPMAESGSSVAEDWEVRSLLRLTRAEDRAVGVMVLLDILEARLGRRVEASLGDKLIGRLSLPLALMASAVVLSSKSWWKYAPHRSASMEEFTGIRSPVRAMMSISAISEYFVAKCPRFAADDRPGRIDSTDVRLLASDSARDTVTGADRGGG